MKKQITDDYDDEIREIIAEKYAEQAEKPLTFGGQFVIGSDVVSWEIMHRHPEMRELFALNAIRRRCTDLIADVLGIEWEISRNRHSKSLRKYIKIGESNGN